DEFEIVEGNIYFPPHAINSKYFKESDNKTTCFWKGVASYYNIEVGGEVNPNAAWFYPDPSAKANKIKDYIAFWKGVKVTR
ncbi:MAG: DUF427 domain-containing protein, partial [Candidatus Heimdallarchaeota archaeon]